MKNEFCWAQLQSSHLKKAQDFYLKLFDWTLKDVDYPTCVYTEIDAGKGSCGGMLPTIMPGSEEAPSFWFPYVKVRDIKLYTQRAKDLGAQVLLEPTPTPRDTRYPENGRDAEYMSVIKDPTGAIIGLHQPSYGFDDDPE
jgi:predicted enzyme related to lactoylglutathione lyase